MKSSTSILGLIAAGTASVLASGCCNCCNQRGTGAVSEPLGAHVKSFEETQAKNGLADQFVIYANEWYMGGKTLGPYGEYHILQISKSLPGASIPVRIQPTLDPELNQVRRRFVVGRLLTAGIGDAELRVKVEYPATEGLSGDEAVRVYGRMLTPARGGS